MVVSFPPDSLAGPSFYLDGMQLPGIEQGGWDQRPSLSAVAGPEADARIGRSHAGSHRADLRVRQPVWFVTQCLA